MGIEGIKLDESIYGFACSTFDNAGNLIELYIKPQQGEIKDEAQGLKVFFPYKDGKLDVANGRLAKYLEYENSMELAIKNYNSLVDRDIEKVEQLKKILEGKKIIE